MENNSFKVLTLKNYSFEPWRTIVSEFGALKNYSFRLGARVPLTARLSMWKLSASMSECSGLRRIGLGSPLGNTESSSDPNCDEGLLLTLFSCPGDESNGSPPELPCPPVDNGPLRPLGVTFPICGLDKDRSFLRDSLPDIGA